MQSDSILFRISIHTIAVFTDKIKKRIFAEPGGNLQGRTERKAGNGGIYI